MISTTDIMQITGTVLHAKPLSFAAYLASSREYLERLQRTHEVFRRLSVLVDTDYRAIPTSLVGLEEILADACRDNSNPKDILNSDKTPVLNSASLNRIGFSVWYSSFADDPFLSHVPVERGGVRVMVQGTSAGAEPTGGTILTLPLGSSGGLIASTSVRRLLQVTVESWDLEVAGAKSLQFERAIEQDGDLYSGQWLLYLPFPDLGACLPGDIHWEPFHKGILIETTPHLPDANNPADIAAGKRVREVLDEFGFAWHSTYAIHGWPPDAEESRYEEFITGAPSGRKYRVRCIDFDGYDAERKVLLYAKLFRRLRRQPKQWGLRGWDGPVINEARRQVRAANGEPIEWHVGLEEPAERARTLLAEYTDITEKQLRIIHTPLESLRSIPGAEPQP